MNAEPADIAALRADGDLVAWIRSLTGRPAPAEPKPPDPEPEIPRERPGAWPISGPVARPQFPAAEVDRAVAEYRAWELNCRPACTTTCECPNCTPEEAS
ncbi:hypothetical protein [Streptomyces sp. NPDC051994]|uniref:hypothetical protein n=1 Tax=unclassified Streptomyces TaxID=2593676 RepID=UPI00341B69F8